MNSLTWNPKEVIHVLALQTLMTMLNLTHTGNPTGINIQLRSMGLLFHVMLILVFVDLGLKLKYGIFDGFAKALQ